MYIRGLLHTSLIHISSVFCKKIFLNFGDYFVHFGFSPTKFSGLFSICFEISISNLANTSSSWCHKSSLSFIPIGTLWPTLQPKLGQSHLSVFMALKIIWRPHIRYKHLYSECLDPTDFCYGWTIFGPLADKNAQKGELIELLASENF